MRILKMTTLLLGMLVCATVHGQENEVFGAECEISDMGKSKRGVGQTYIGTDDEYSYTLSTKGFLLYGIPMGVKITINKWDKDMNLITSGDIPMKTDDYKLSIYAFGEFHMAGDRLVHLIEYKNKKEDKFEVFLAEYDKNSFELIESTPITSFPGKKRRNSSTGLAANPAYEGGFILWTCYEVDDNSSKMEVFAIDNELSVEQEWNFDFDESYSRLFFQNMDIDEDQVSFVSHIRPDEDDEDSEYETIFRLMSRKDESVMIELPIDLNEVENSVSDFELRFSEDGKLFVSGFYRGDGNKEGDTGGAFTQVYDLKKEELLEQDLFPFDFQFLTENMSKRGKKRAERRDKKGKAFDPYTFYVRDVITNKDGSSLMIGERYRFYTTTYTDSQGRTHTVYHYIHSDIILMRTAKDGTIEWVERYERFHHATNSDLTGQFVVHDNEKTVEILYSAGDLRMAQISKDDGSSETETVFTAEEIGKFATMMGTAEKVDENRFVIQLARGKKAKLITINFDN
ncbi:MAG: hypothetical protein NXI10_03385 [bacterium]|nr:hypothetical protein [bacterium]